MAPLYSFRDTRAVGAALLVTFLIAPSVQADAQPGCYFGLSQATTSAGVFRYIEDEPASPSSEGRLELVQEGRVAWSVAASRGCSLGISVCRLALEYRVDEGESESIVFDMSFGCVQASTGETICVTVVSQMGEMLAYLHRRYSSNRLTFTAGSPDAPTLVMTDYLRSVPSVFQSCGCGAN